MPVDYDNKFLKDLVRQSDHEVVEIPKLPLGTYMQKRILYKRGEEMKVAEEIMMDLKSEGKKLDSKDKRIISGKSRQRLNPYFSKALKEAIKKHF